MHTKIRIGDRQQNLHMKTTFLNFRLAFVIMLLILSSTNFCIFGQAIRIDEFMASNQTTIADEDGDFSDWIEIHNPAASAVNLSGWSLTDEKAVPKKWVFPEISLEPNGYLLVFASGKDKTTPGSELHTNFKLSASGEYFALISNSGAEATEFDPAFPAQEADISYGFFENTYVSFTTPTPGSETPSSIATIIPAPLFSKAHGFYDAAFSLEITSSLASAEIYYTTDGSVPGISNGTLYTSALNIDSTAIIRALAMLTGQEPSKPATRTFLFLNDIIHQSNNPAGYPAEWGPYTALNGNAIADYEMDPELISDTNYANAVKVALKDLPTISLVTDKDHLFSAEEDPETGGIYIYTGPPLSNTRSGTGDGWERPVSFEYFADDDSTSLQVDCGVRLQGGHSRRPEKSPKHSFRLVFRSEYGPSTLNYPLFGNDVGSSFNSITLRAGFCNTFIHHESEQRNRSQYLRDSWGKDVQRAMGHAAASNDFAHLYINGIYWGLYNTSERIDRRFAESHFRGNDIDFDVIKDYTEVVDGEIDAWDRMMDMADAGLETTEAFQKIQGNNPDGTPNGEYENLLDMDNFIDYMIINFYGGNTDWDHHNWAAIRNREKPGKGFNFICWDSEHILKDVYDTDAIFDNNANCPSHIYQSLAQNADFRRLFADRVAEHCYNNGFLTPDKSKEIWLNRTNQIENSIVAEAARWGDYRKDVHPFQTQGPFDLYTKESHWIPQQDFMQNTYFPLRTEVFINALTTYGLYPALGPPAFMINDMPVTQNYVNMGDLLSMSSAEGVIYYTTDGSDPVDWSTSEESTDFVIILGEDDKKVLVPKSDIGTSWMSDVNYDDSGWQTCSGPFGGIGYDTDPESFYHQLISLDVQNDMNVSGASPNTSCYVRIEFDLTEEDLNNIGTLLLPVAYEDGFAAYLNGNLVAQSNVSLPLSWNANNSVDHPLQRAEFFNISPFIDSLVVGTNLLAIQGVNNSTSSQNFFIYAEMFARDKAENGEVTSSAKFYSAPLTLNNSSHVKARSFKNGVWSPIMNQFFVIPSELYDLKITEVLYHAINNSCSNDSADGDKFEFLEIKNTGSSVLGLGDLKFEQGIDYEFESNSSIGPGEFILLARDSKYFYERYGIVPFDEYSGKLNNDGERIVITSLNGDTISSFKYNDNENWPQEADGEGNSLVPTETNPTNDQDSSIYWRASFEFAGSPGADDIEGVEYVSDDCGTVIIPEPQMLTQTESIVLDQNYPNPFRDLTYIHYKLEEGGHIKLSVYNVMGQHITTLVDAYQTTGHQLVTWDCTDNSSGRVNPGIYFYRLEIMNDKNHNVLTKKMIKTN